MCEVAPATFSNGYLEASASDCTLDWQTDQQILSYTLVMQPAQCDSRSKLQGEDAGRFLVCALNATMIPCTPRKLKPPFSQFWKLDFAGVQHKYFNLKGFNATFLFSNVATA